ncbi:EboA domain-containing protein [Dactylosporangium vinaceum]|uniref:EboA domain-containing protein n=1 Tax=Dactylosporangium vinaceum TaxID=53362 RepID=A0ABV5MMW4_9ACTN|nr:EboA domain-containing protein [Dactylosporangium vinaceum]UAB98619.1 EboA domain-containing protein [Dactylosporangium vinaceum]
MSLETLLRTELTDTVWLDTALETVARQPSAIVRLFPAVGRRCGRWMLPEPAGWSVDDAARVLLLLRLKDQSDVPQLYRHGDAAEKRAVLRALPQLDLSATDMRTILHDALRTNDTRLVAAALGPAARVLDAAAWRQGVLKAVFMGLALPDIADLDERADAELTTMLAGLAEERRAAGRSLAPDAAELLERLTTMFMRRAEEHGTADRSQGADPTGPPERASGADDATASEGGDAQLTATPTSPVEEHCVADHSLATGAASVTTDAAELPGRLQPQRERGQ